ncbi:MAG: hypothetical protein AAB597_00135 [Patescibacteria group bacterium]
MNMENVISLLGYWTFGLACLVTMVAIAAIFVGRAKHKTNQQKAQRRQQARQQAQAAQPGGTPTPPVPGGGPTPPTPQASPNTPTSTWRYEMAKLAEWPIFTFASFVFAAIVVGLMLPGLSWWNWELVEWFKVACIAALLHLVGYLAWPKGGGVYRRVVAITTLVIAAIFWGPPILESGQKNLPPQWAKWLKDDKPKTPTTVAGSQGGRQIQSPATAYWQTAIAGTSGREVAVLDLSVRGKNFDWKSDRKGCLAAFVKYHPDDPDFKDKLSLVCTPGYQYSCWRKVIASEPPQPQPGIRLEGVSRVRFVSVDCQPHLISWKIT